MRLPTQNGREREHEKCEEESLLRSDAVTDPARRGDPDGDGKQVAKHDPFNASAFDVELIGEGGDCNIDNGRVHDFHEQAEDENDGNDPLVFEWGLTGHGSTVDLRSLG